MDYEYQWRQYLVHSLLVINLWILSGIIEKNVSHDRLNLLTLEKINIGKGANHVLLDSRLKLHIGKVTIPMTLFWEKCKQLG